jgi:hypothetical protein
MDILEIINDFIKNHEEEIKNLSSYGLKSLSNYQEFLNEYSLTAEDNEREPLIVFLEFVNEQEKKINEYYGRYEDDSNFLDCTELCTCIARYLEDGVLFYQYDDLMYCDETSVHSSYVEEYFKDELRTEVYRKLSPNNLSDYFDYDGYLDGFCDIFEVLEELDICYVTEYPKELNGDVIYIIGDRSYALR